MDASPSIVFYINASMDVNAGKSKLKAIWSHQFNGEVLELLVNTVILMLNGNPFDLVKSYDAHTVATYLLTHNLGVKSNEIYCRWARSLLLATKRMIRRMKQSNMNCFYQSSYHPTNKNLRS